MAVELVKSKRYGLWPSGGRETVLTSQCLVCGVLAKSVPGTSASAMMTVYTWRRSENSHEEMKRTVLTESSVKREAPEEVMSLSSGADETAVGEFSTARPFLSERLTALRQGLAGGEGRGAEGDLEDSFGTEGGQELGD